MPVAKTKLNSEPHILEVEIGKVDDKRRITLPKMKLAKYYEIEITEDEEIILRPRTLVDPRDVISKKTRSVLDESMMNLQAGRVGNPIDLSAFEVADEKEKTLSKK